MTPIRIVFLLSLCVMTAGCGGAAHYEQLTGNYLLIATSSSDQMEISYDVGDGGSIGRINETVFSVGWDQRYIVAKQHPNNDRAVTNYYYLEMAKDSRYADPSASVTGPMTAQEFASKQNELKLPPFTRTIKSLE